MKIARLWLKCFVLGFVGAAVPASMAIAGEVAVETRDGQLYVGEIVDQDTSQVRLKTKVNNIQLVMTLSRKEIISIKETSLPDSWLDGGGIAEAPNERGEAAADDGPSYLIVPMRGVIGEEVMADGLEQVIRFAKRSGVSHLVLDIDSPGGYASEGRRIGDVIRAAKADLTFVAYVRSALSAAVIPTISSQWIFYEPEAQIGAAVAYRWVPETGAAEVDEKFLSAISAIMAAAAESNGHNPDIVRAMVIPRLKLHAWRTPGGEEVVSGEAPPKDAQNVRTIDDERSVLTLTARQAAELRFGEISVEQGIAGLGEKVGAPGWRLYSNYGETAMRHAKSTQEEATSVLDRFNSVASSVNALIGRAVSRDPKVRVKVYYDLESGILTAQSRNEWRRQTDAAVKAWDAVVEAITELERLDARHKQLTRQSLLESRKDIRKFKDEARDQQKRLKAERNRRTV